MKVKELRPRQGKVDITVEVVDKGEIREFDKFGKKGKVANVQVRDDSGEIRLTLWNEDAERIKVGDKLKLTNCFVNEFQGEKQLTAGRLGKIEVITKPTKE